MSEPIRDVETAVRELGALPVPVGSEPLALSGPICSQAEARAAGLDIAPTVAELDAMAETIVAAGDPLSAEVSLAQAVPLLGAAVTGLRAQVAALLEERHRTNEWADDAAKALRADRDRIAELEGRLVEYEQSAKDPRACAACGDLPEQWCPDCAACRKGCFGGNEGNPCAHPNAPWRTAEADGIMRRNVPLQTLREDPHDGPLHHDYRVGRDLPPVGGAS